MGRPPAYSTEQASLPGLPSAAAGRLDESLMQVSPMSMAGRTKALCGQWIFEDVHNNPSQSGSGLKETQVPSDGNHFCRTLAYAGGPILLTPGDATARLREVGTARYVMDEASAAQPIEQPCTPRSGFHYMRFSFCMQSM